MAWRRPGIKKVKISRGARLEVQYGIWSIRTVYMLKMDGFEMGPKKILIKWSISFFSGGAAKRSSRCRKWGGAKPRHIPTDSQRGSAPPPSLNLNGLRVGWGATGVKRKGVISTYKFRIHSYQSKCEWVDITIQLLCFVDDSLPYVKSKKTKSYHDANFVITGGTAGCTFESLWCDQWPKKLVLW